MHGGSAACVTQRSRDQGSLRVDDIQRVDGVNARSEYNSGVVAMQVIISYPIIVGRLRVRKIIPR
jgi:hypothetical protein